MAKYYPDQKPAFLFDEIERKTHTAINADSFRALQADLEAAKADFARERDARIEAEKELDQAAQWGHGVNGELSYFQSELESVRAERNALAKLTQSPPLAEENLHQRERKALLAIIRALAELQSVKPIPTREDGDGWSKAAIALQSQFAHKGIKSPVSDKTLAKHLRNAFSDKDF